MTDSAKAIYDELSVERAPFLQQARENAKYTLPYLIRWGLGAENGNRSSAELPQPYQSIGARGVNNISSKLALALFPVNQLFFRFGLADGSDPDDAQEKELRVIEDAIYREFETKRHRVHANSALLHAIVAGNALYLADEKPRVFHLDSYCIQRDPRGNLVKLAVVEVTHRAALPENIQKDLPADQGDTSHKHRPDELEVYTAVVREDENTYREWQEINGKQIGATKTYKTDELPWIPLTFLDADGEDYGRGYVEQYLGDLRSLEGLSKAAVEGAAGAAKVVFLVKPGAMTKISDLTESSQFDVKVGNADDVTVVQAATPGLTWVHHQMERVEQRLGYAFLLNSTVQRQAERVTAEEIRFVARELDDQLGGAFTQMSARFQKPLVQGLLGVLTRRSGGIPKKVAQDVAFSITTGLSAIGRNHEVEQANLFVQLMVAAGADAYINKAALGQQLATNTGVDADLVLSEGDVQQARAQALLAQMGEKATPELAKQFFGQQPAA